ncbi:NitT/TauT family transport system permease protein [Geodermatophilus bullaregiensis]|uniref:ABC transporter permease n=1 Tax=Geodermatophilus bullaregiensis TaxID=1564160 RepID=UPI00195F197E|nr:ABC transporter permease [Geodermatophilus bullaregiensis]MBM7808026.1 NitT/TauT family transport system permease protein [Geodermatophilus bullaregiensis]
MPLRRHGGISLAVKALAPTLIIAAMWELYARLSRVPDYILPAPSEVWLSFTQHYEALAAHALVTLQESLAGLLLGVMIGSVTATVLYSSRSLRTALMPLLIMFNSFPKIAIAPVLILWLGTGVSSKVVLSALLVFFPITVNVLAGLMRVDPELLELFRSWRATSWTIFRMIRIPTAFPHFVDGVKVAIPLAVIGALIGEFIGASKGLGYLLLLAGSSLDVSLQFAALITMGLISLIPFYLLRHVQSRIARRWSWGGAEG